MKTVILLMCVAICQTQRLAQQTCDINGRQTEVQMNGANAVINGIFSLRVPGLDGYGCGPIAEDLMQVYEAARWSLTNINNRNFVPGVKIGMKVFDDCESQFSALSAATESFPQYITSATYCTKETPLNLGILGPFTSSASIKVSDFAGKFMASVLSPRATSAELSNKNLYPSFLRTTPSMKALATAIVKLLQRMNWAKVTIVHTDDAYGISGMNELLNAAYLDNVCVSQVIKIPSVGTVSEYTNLLKELDPSKARGGIFFGANRAASVAIEAMSTQPNLGDIQWIYSDLSPTESQYNKYARGSLVVTTDNIVISEFQSYYENLVNDQSPENPWFTRQFVPSPYEQNLYVDTTVKAVYAYAVALRNAQQLICGVISNGICDNLKRITPSEFHNTYLKNVDYEFVVSDGMANMIGQKINFDVNGDPVSSDFAIYSYNDILGNYRFVKAGGFTGGAITTDINALRFYDSSRNNPLPNIPNSLCPPGGCSNCYLPSNKLSYSYIPGDIVFLSLASHHFPGREPLTCDRVSNTGAQMNLALKFAIQNFKTRFPNTLNGVNLGMLLVDPCYDGLLAESFVSSLMGGRITYKDSNQNDIDPSLIKGIVQASTATITKSVSSVTSQFGIPEMGLTPSLELGNKEMYPYYTRYHPSDKHVIMAMLSTLQRLGWQYIQVVYKTDDYHVKQVQEFKKWAAMSSICVVSELTFDESGPILIDKLRLMANQTQVVLLLGWPSDIRSIFSGTILRQAQSEFVFMGVSWEMNLEAIRGFEAQAEGSLILTQDVSANAQFENTLRRVTTEDIQRDPVFAAWYESVLDCYLQTANPFNYRVPCSNQAVLSNSNYEPSLMATFAINGVYAMGRALHKTLEIVCGTGYSGVCANYTTSDTSKIFMDILQNDVFTDSSNNQFSIRDGEVLTNFKINSYRRNLPPLQISEYNTAQEQITSFNPGQYGGIRSSCSGPCPQCYYMYRHQPFVYQPGDILVGGMFSISNPSGNGPYQCGDARITNGFQYTAAMLYAIEQVNSGSAPVNFQGGLKVGGLALDHCNTAQRPTGLLSNIYSGIYDYSWMKMNNMYEGLMPEKIPAWMFDTSSSSLEAAQVLQPINVPIVGPSATSSSLKNIKTFYRTVQGDDATATAILRLSKTLGFQYLQAIGSNSNYGRTAISNLRDIGFQEGVCISNSYIAGTDGNFTNIIDKILQANSEVVVAYLSTNEMVQFMNAKSSLSQARNLLVITPEPTRATLGATAENMLSLKVRSPYLTGYNQYLAQKSNRGYDENVYFARYYSELAQCNMPGTYTPGRPNCPENLIPVPNIANYIQDTYAISTIDSVYAIVSAVDATLKQLCGENYDSVCSAYTNQPGISDLIQQNLNKVEFGDPSGHDFRFRDRDGNIPFEILRYNGNAFVNVGDYAGASIQINDGVLPLYQNVKTACSRDCTECIQAGISFTHVPGDILLGGMFDVHEKSVNPFLCGKINTLHGFQLLEAFHFALNYINDKEGIFADKLQGVRVGGVGLDACQSTIRTGYLVSNIHNGLVSLSKNGEDIDPKDIDAYIGAYSSDSSAYLSRILNDLEIPQISYASSSSELNNQMQYPYLYRTVPSDINLAEAMVDFLDKYNIRYVQVLYTDNSYGNQGARVFQEAAKKKKICIAQMVSYSREGSLSEEISDDVVTALVQKPKANTVVVFAGTQYINALLRAVGKVSNSVSKRNFTFIGSQTWGNSEDAIIGSERFASGSVTFGLKIDDLSEFDEYISTKTPLNSQRNPWFSEYYEEMWNCYLSVSTLRFREQCPQRALSIITSRRYKQDPGVLHVINSVFSSALALDMTLKEICGDGYTTVCEAYKNRKNRRDILLQKLDQVNFVDLSFANFTFNNREGNKGYTLYSVQPQAVTMGYIYKKIGSFSNDGMLEVDDDYEPDWDGSCERDDACSECPTVRNPGQRYTVVGPSGTLSPNTLTLVSVFDIHRLGLDEFRCGELNLNSGFLEYMAFNYALTRLVSDLDVRGLVLDTCSNNLRVEQDIYSLLANSELCNSIYSVQPPVHAASIGGFIVSNDMNTESAGRVLDPLGYTYVSPSATSIMFNDKNNYNSLLRTIAPRSELLKEINKVLNDGKWSYLSVMVSYDQEETEAYNSFRSMADQDQICLGSPVRASAPMDMPTAMNALESLYDSSRSRVIILFTNMADTKVILEAAKEKGYLDKFFWIFTDIWAFDLIQWRFEYDMKFEGLIVQLRTSVVQSFQDYLQANMDYQEAEMNRNSAGIPREWFEEWYQRIHRCQLEDAINSRPSATACTKLEKLNVTLYSDARILNTIAGVYTAAEGIKEFMTSCEVDESFASCVSRRPNARDEILEEIKKVQWVMSNSVRMTGVFDVNYNEDQFWNQGYDVSKIDVNIRKNGNDQMDLSRDLSSLGNWMAECPKDEDGEELEACNCPEPPASRGQGVTSGQTGTDPLSILPPEPRNYFYYSNDEKLYDWPLWAIVVAVLTCLGILISVIVFVYLLFAYPVRSGTTILGFLTLLGIIFIYVLNFAFFFPASMETCTTRRLLMGIVYAIVFGPLLVKAVDNWFRKDSDFSAEQYRGLTSSCALLLMAVGIILIQAIIPIEWLILVKPTASQTFNSYFHDYWWCDPVDEYDVGLVLSMIFVMFLVILTAIFSGLSWESWRNNYESRWIFIASVCTAGCFFVWMIVVTNAGAPVRDAAVTIGNFVNASALLLCIPLRKMILLCNYRNEKEELNGGQDLYNNIYENPSFDPDVEYHNNLKSSRPVSETGF